MFEFSVSLGVLAVYILSFWLLSTKNENDLLNPEEKWQLLLFVPGVPAFFLLAQYVLGYLPASPRWLLLRNRHAEARNVLLLVAASSSSSSNSTQVENELNIIKHAILLERRLENHSKSVSNRLKSIVCAAGLMLFQVLVGIDLFTVYFFYICRRAAMPLSDSGNLLVLTGVVCSLSLSLSLSLGHLVSQSLTYSHTHTRTHTYTNIGTYNCGYSCTSSDRSCWKKNITSSRKLGHVCIHDWSLDDDHIET